MLIEIHMIQNHTPSNLNRDDLGAPKTCVFGGAMRARISSQCIKRSIRNPGNPQDIHSRGAGLFARSMAGNIGTRTKYFPWLVERELKHSTIPQEEHARIVQAASRIAVGADKGESRTSSERTSDSRPKTAQLIHLGPGHATYYVQRLAELRTKMPDQYSYFLDPKAGFQEMVIEFLADAPLDEETRKKIAKAAWRIAKCRMVEMLEASGNQDTQTSIELDGQPGPSHARLIAEILLELKDSDSSAFKTLTRPESKEERTQIGQDAPKEPKGMNDFVRALRNTTQCDAADIALFGRMTTSDAFPDVEAAMQVAHAISTHEVVNEVDYFTAVDDLARSGSGAGHVDEAMFTSACYYKYFSLDWDQLVKNLNGNTEPHDETKRLAARITGHFIEAAALTTPSGKQNSFASHCEPCGILVEIKKDGAVPTDYANAFAEPIERTGKPSEDAPDEQSLEGRSIACLADHVHALRKAYGTDSSLVWYSPKLWRYPLRYWERADDGKRLKPRLLTDRRFDTLEGLIQEVVAYVVPELPWTNLKHEEAAGG